VNNKANFAHNEQQSAVTVDFWLDMVDSARESARPRLAVQPISAIIGITLTRSRPSANEPVRTTGCPSIAATYAHLCSVATELAVFASERFRRHFRSPKQRGILERHGSNRRSVEFRSPPGDSH
jgi:hypothetical protein